jgi:L-cysteine desulfidase
VRLEKIEIEEAKIILSLLSKDEKKLTELLKDFTHKEIYSVSTKEIVKEDKSSYYSSDVSVKVQ